MKKKSIPSTLRLIITSVILAITISGCNDNPPCRSTLDVIPKRFQTLTRFTLKGEGFRPGTRIYFFVNNQPQPLSSDPKPLGSVVTNNQGKFDVDRDIAYLSGLWNDSRTPWFTASDQNGCNGIKETSAAYWFAR